MCCRGCATKNKQHYIDTYSEERAKLEQALESIDNGITSLRSAGFTREWKDEELGRMSFFHKHA